MKITAINNTINTYNRRDANYSAGNPNFQSKNFKQIKHVFIDFKEALVDRRLDKKSEACEFFGSKSFRGVQEQLHNHFELALLNHKKKNVIMSLCNEKSLNLDNPNWEKTFKQNLSKNDSIKNLLEKGAARVNLHSRFFGKRSQSGAHAIGIVVNPEDKKLYVLDSLPRMYKTVRKYQNKLKGIFTEELTKTTTGSEKPYEIIFSSKFQQLYTGGYTCDNWTHANIDAVQNALKNGIKINNQAELNAVLPDNINTILQEQQKFVINNRSTRYF